MGRVVSKVIIDDLSYIMPWGKYKDQSFQILLKDINYLVWLLDSETFEISKKIKIIIAQALEDGEDEYEDEDNWDMMDKADCQWDFV